MAEVAQAFVSLIPSAKGFGRGIQSSIGGDLDKAGRDSGKRFGGAMSSGLAGVGSKVFAPLAAAAAAIGVKDFLGDAISEARESQKVGALTAQVIKTTGGAAKVTAGQIGDLATAISNKTGIDDEAIQSASNLLLTFTNVRNEVGKGNDVFNQATQIATDMGAALGGDPKSSAIQLGKALNDPIKGVTALQRVGVSFTASQKDQIKTLVKSGNTLGAQKVILGELNKEFGGAAAASATAGEKLSVAFGNFKEQIGTALLPVIDKVAGFLTDKIVPAMSTFFSEMQTGKGAGGAFVAIFKNLWAAVQPLAQTLLTNVVPAIRGFFASFVSGGGASAALGMFNSLKSVIMTLAPVVIGFVQGALSQMIPAFVGIYNAIRGFISVALPIVQQFVTGMLARLGPMIPMVRGIFSQVASIVTTVTGLLSAIWSQWGQGFMNLIASVFSAVIGIVGPALSTIKAIIATVTAAIRGDWSGVWNGIKAIIAGVFGIIKGIVSGALGILKQLWGATLTAIGGAISRAWNDFTSTITTGMTRIRSAVSTGISNVLTFFRELPGKVVSVLSGLASALYSSGSNAVLGFIQGLGSQAGNIIATVRDKIVGVLPDFVKEFLGIHSPSTVMAELGRWAGIGFAQGLAGTSKQITSAVTSLMSKVDSLMNKTVSKVVKGKGGKNTKVTVSLTQQAGLSASAIQKLKSSALAAEKVLTVSANRRDAIAKRLVDAQKRLKTLQADAAKYAADARSKVLETGSVANGGSFSGIIKGLQRSVTQAKEFATAVAQLRRYGLNSTSLDQIIQAGPQAGLAAAKQILTKGGAAGIKQVNSLVGQLASSATSVGKSAADAMYGAGINAANGLVKGLQSQKTAIEKTMSSIATALVTQVKRALKIKSPSRVFMQIGAFTGEGMALGIGSQAGSVQAAADGLVPTLRAGNYRARVAAPVAAGGAEYLRLHPNDKADLIEGFGRSRPVATLGRDSFDRQAGVLLG